MSDKEVIKENFKIKISAGGKSSALYYIIVPIAFTAIALIMLSPAAFKANRLVKNYTASMQERLSRNNSSIVTFDNDFYTPDYTADGQISLDKKPVKGDKIASLVCENSGVNTNVYYGTDIQILGRGAGLNTDYALFGSDKAVMLEGLASEAFKNFDNFSKGDIIKVTAYYGTFEYRVTGRNIEENNADLILCCNSSKKPFMKGERLYICAEKISGPVLISGEVQQ